MTATQIKLSAWPRYKSELVVSNFEGRVLERFLVIHPLGLEKEQDLYLDQSSRPFWKRTLSLADKRKLVRYFRSGLAFRIEYFAERNHEWILINSKNEPSQYDLERLERDLEEQDFGRKVAIRTLLVLLAAFVLVSLVHYLVTSAG